jgi:hypothetical protein
MNWQRWMHAAIDVAETAIVMLVILALSLGWLLLR